MTDQTKALRQLIAGTSCLPALGVFDGFSARIAVRAGAPILHASGGAIARAIGHPDTGLVTMSEMLGRVSEIVAASAVPVFADADTGYGNEANAARAARCYRAAGVAGLHVEDQTFPKRCGHMDGVEVIPAARMIDKIKAMKDAVGTDVLIAARTDAVAVEGLEAALHRMAFYLEAGADMAFVEGIETLSDIGQMRDALPRAAMVFNQAKASAGGAIALETLAMHGVRIALYPGDMQRGAAWAMQAAATAIMQTAATTSVAEAMLTNAQRDAFFS